MAEPPAAAMPARPSRPIEDHGVIGDRSTVALVATDGAIDFLCWPRFDSPTVFASLLDRERGGEFLICPDLENARLIQRYLPATNVLVTQFLAEGGSAELTDAMLPTHGADGGLPRVIRRIRATRGTVRFSVRCQPRFDYARTTGQSRATDGGVMFETATVRLRLSTDQALLIGDGEANAEFELAPGQTADFVLDAGEVPPMTTREITAAFGHTVHFWRDWISHSTYRGRWREMVERSALALKLLCSREHGSILAAATFGLPEAPGGPRNWDYRAVWIRDASFTVYAFMRLGFRQEAEDFIAWVQKRASEAEAGRIRIMYGVDGSSDLGEQELDHLGGFNGARPVRIGNDAAGQTQLDIYGELLDSVYLANKYGQAISHDGWNHTKNVVAHVCAHWRDADAGIWEFRNDPREFLHSRLMCWVAVDRALRLAEKRSLAAPFEEWANVRNEIHADIWENFWNAECGHFVQARGSTDVDAALLLMPLVRFVGATDPKWLATLDAISERLTEDGMVFRYRADDGLEGTEGAFTCCSFWYVECLARAGRLDEAHDAFEKTLAHSNHVGLFSEELGKRGEHLGNFPQGLTHLALISAAFFLDRELSGQGGTTTWRP